MMAPKEKKGKKMNILTTSFRRLTACILLVAAIGGSAAAQTNDQYCVLKVRGSNHYLAHVKVNDTWTLQDATSFSPDCLWQTGTHFNPAGTNHNYYFYADGDYHFLAAPLQANGTIYISASMPGTSVLRNDNEVYYFFNWDAVYGTYGPGVSRGVQILGTDAANQSACEACSASWGGNPGREECWKVFWVEYDEGGTNQWKMSNASHYNMTANSAGAETVTITEHSKEVTSETGGLADLSDFSMDYNDSPKASHNITATVSNYTYTAIPAYTTYVFNGVTHNYYNNSDNGTSTPSSSESSGNTATSYEWTITGDGAQYLSFSNSDGTVKTWTSNLNPTVYYYTSNDAGHKTATLTLTVTYSDASTQVRTATITVNTPCQNPATNAAVVDYEGATVSWVNTSNKYKVEWRVKEGPGAWNEAIVENASSYTIKGLAYNTTYEYRVTAFCNGSFLTSPSDGFVEFTTTAEPNLLVYGAVFGGGRMANVTGNTEVVIINCDSISAVYGGNDIAGAVQGSDGSLITLGVDANDPHDYDDYGTTNATIKIGSVYGGGNGYYAYNGSSFSEAGKYYASQSVAVNGTVNAMTRNHQVGAPVWTNDSENSQTLNFPSIVKTAIVVTNNYVKIDSLFGGAKNAFLTTDNGNGSSITINGGTIYSVFGGNNFGGTQGYGLHYIEVNGTSTNLTPGIANTPTTNYGRTFGVRYLFGGGNKVAGSTTNILVKGGQIDTLYAGGNSADVHAANVTVNCNLANGSTNNTFGKTYTYVFDSYSGTITPKNNYAWNGTGIYNVRTLFGGNNAANMAAVPNITLTSGSIGTAYGGGNAGDMLAQATDDGNGNDLVINGNDVKYGTHIVTNSANILVDQLYGGCQKSNVDYSTWVEVKNGHIGTVYGGCNISGDVGSTKVNPNAPTVPVNLADQAVYGATYVIATGGTVYKNLFAGSNGFYHCNNGTNYVSGINYDDTPGYYIGMAIPTHNETYAIISKDDGAGTSATIKGNVYAGGNLAYVGFTDATASGTPYPQFVGLASVRMDAGLVEGNIYGGGNMADIYGNSEVQVSGGTIQTALYGGNDRTGQVGAITNRILPSDYSWASDGEDHTPLTDVRTYVGITGNPTITTVYGGGNGDYDYEHGDSVVSAYCEANDYPIQKNTFVDIGIDGGANGGHITEVYGGGNGVTVTGFIKVLLNVKTATTVDNVGTIFGGNNKGDLKLVPDIILLNGQVGTVYGGCNQGAMTGTTTVTSGTNTYTDVSSLVRLRDVYTTEAGNATPNVKISNAVYGGCKMNGATNNTLVLVEGGTHTCNLFGGSDISGTVCGTATVAVKGSSSIANAFGGGNGNYDYTTSSSPYYGLTAPYCKATRVDMLGGSAANLYAGGYAGPCGDTYMNVTGGTVSGNVFGGGNEAGTTTDSYSLTYKELNESTYTYTKTTTNVSGTGTSTVVMNGGTVSTSVYGGCNTLGSIASTSTVTINAATLATNVFGGGKGEGTSVAGNVTVTIGTLDGTGEPTVGTVYGGSEEGSVNTNSNNTTTVNIYNGTVNAAVYGGGKGVTGNTTKGTVNGVVVVNIGSDSQTDAQCKLNLRGCTVYGCNNAGGSPKDTVTVHVWKTGHISTDIADYEGNSPTYAIDQVFGGGNAANYSPTANQRAKVYIHNCDNTVRRVFGGGNAANAKGVTTIIDGGRFDYVFGGGNGEVTEANITPNGVVLTIHAGKITQLYNGSNANGTITGGISATLEHSDVVCADDDIDIDEYFCGNNAADINGDVVTTIACSQTNPIKVTSLYGGSNVANIHGNVELTVEGGIITNVYGGSKGRLANSDPSHPTAKSAVIDGHVILTIKGGTIKNVFGGCNILGDIKDSIIVNVFQEGLCTLNLDNVYGGGNMAAYNPLTDSVGAARIVPLVNIQKGTVNNTVYGGGLGSTAEVTANPKVIVGGEVSSTTYECTIGSTTIDGATGAGNVFGGGNAAQVNGSTSVEILNKSTIRGNVYGGGNEAVVTGSTDVKIGD